MPYFDHKKLERALFFRRLANYPGTLTKDQLAGIVYFTADTDNKSLRFYESQDWRALLSVLDNTIENACLFENTTAQANCVSAATTHRSIAGNNVSS
jgi:hypothetical protein